MSEIFPPKTPYCSIRRPCMIIIHGTEVDAATTRAVFAGQHTHKGSSHYFINIEGEIEQFVDDSMRCWHAGKSYWAGHTDVNSISVGIELEYISPSGKFTVEEGSYEPKQIEQLVKLIKKICNTPDYQIAPHHILGHQDISPERKLDPGILFPWQNLAENGIGVWHGLEPIKNDPVIKDNQFKLKLGLYGYDIRENTDLTSVIRAFQTHFMPWNICGQVTEQSVKIIDILLEKKYEQV